MSRSTPRDLVASVARIHWADPNSFELTPARCAHVLSEAALAFDDDSPLFEALMAIADALTSPDAPIKVVLKGVRRGPRRRHDLDRAKATWYAVRDLINVEGIRSDAAVRRVAEEGIFYEIGGENIRVFPPIGERTVWRECRAYMETLLTPQELQATNRYDPFGDLPPAEIAALRSADPPGGG